MSILCTICARSGSKGVPNKNIKILSGKPLLAYTINYAKDSGLFDKQVEEKIKEKKKDINWESPK